MKTRKNPHLCFTSFFCNDTPLCNDMGYSLWCRTCSIHDWKHLHGLEFKQTVHASLKKVSLKWKCVTKLFHIGHAKRILI